MPERRLSTPHLMNVILHMLLVLCSRISTLAMCDSGLASWFAHERTIFIYCILLWLNSTISWPRPHLTSPNKLYRDDSQALELKKESKTNQCEPMLSINIGTFCHGSDILRWSLRIHQALAPKTTGPASCEAQCRELLVEPQTGLEDWRDRRGSCWLSIGNQSFYWGVLSKVMYD